MNTKGNLPYLTCAGYVPDLAYSVFNPVTILLCSVLIFIFRLALIAQFFTLLNDDYE